MLEATEKKSISTEYSNDDVLAHLRMIIQEFLSTNSHMTINGLSKRCSVSEPTLRRINKGQVKTLPTITTIIDILSYISKETNVTKIMGHFPGPVAEFIKERAHQFDENPNIEYSEQLTQALEEPVKYLIYKLSCGVNGVTMDKVVELFGRYGATQLQELVQENLMVKKDVAYYARIDSFTLSDDVFVKHFKAVADFIKPHKHPNSAKAYSPIFANYSSSLSKEAYSNILKIQRLAFRKILRIMSDEKSAGPVPTFVIGAVDTLDNKCADEF